jgi:hypothetical protein
MERTLLPGISQIYLCSSAHILGDVSLAINSNQPALPRQSFAYDSSKNAHLPREDELGGLRRQRRVHCDSSVWHVAARRPNPPLLAVGTKVDSGATKVNVLVRTTITGATQTAVEGEAGFSCVHDDYCAFDITSKQRGEQAVGLHEQPRRVHVGKDGAPEVLSFQGPVRQRLPNVPRKAYAARLCWQDRLVPVRSGRAVSRRLAGRARERHTQRQRTSSGR